MGVLIIGDEEKAAVKIAMEKARAHPVSIEAIKAGALNRQERSVFSLKDRKPDFKRPPSENVMFGTYRAAISFEQQPIGLCKHLSISTIRPGTVPGEAVIRQVMKLFGFKIGVAGQVWFEEFDPGHVAINIVQADYDDPLPRCEHGNCLRDGGGELLEPPCGCRME